MTTCHEADTTFSRRNGQRMPGCLTAWLPGSIQFQLEPVLNRFLLLFLFHFFSRFSIFPIFFPPWFFCICCWRWFCSFIRHYRRTMRAVCRLLLWLNVVQYSYYVGEMLPARQSQGQSLKPPLKSVCGDACHNRKTELTVCSL